MTLIIMYPSKKELKTQIGGKLKYLETSLVGAEYPADGTGVVYGSNRPHHPLGYKGKGVREFYAKITLDNHTITKVE